ncbi:MAG: NADH-quinone oxidoreductase subunit C [Longimicrobiales bacterium]
MSDDAKSGLDALDEGPRPSDPSETVDAPAANPDDHPSVAGLMARFGNAVVHHEEVSGGQHVVHVDPARNVEIITWLRDDPAHAYNHLADVTCVDFGGGAPLQVVYQLFSMEHKRSLRVKCLLPLDGLEIDSVVPLWNGANWLEREVYDLFGVTFRNHPDLRRILMPQDYAEGHPLRKDFPLRGRFSRAEQTRRALAQDVDRFYIPSERAAGREPQEVFFPDPDRPVPADAGDGQG